MRQRKLRDKKQLSVVLKHFFHNGTSVLFFFKNNLSPRLSLNGVTTKHEWMKNLVIEEVVDLSKQINLKVNSNGVKEVLDSHNQVLTMDELIEMHEQEKDVEERESLDPVQSEDRMTVGNLT
ncbi:hypothetical protein TNCV_2537121 [Trichonephila clavipes]|nr:hypothetical protein TNCV_2537121 [Trichonephila clavipes]